MNRFLQGAMILTLAGLLVKIIGAASKFVIARILGGEGIGLYQMAYPIYQVVVAIAAAGVPVAISIMIAEKLANKDMRGIEKVYRVSFYALSVIGFVSCLALYFLAEPLVAWHVVSDARALYALQALAPSLLLVTMLASFRGYFQGFQYMVPTGVSQICEQVVRVSTMVILAWLFLGDGLEYAAAGATFATFPGVFFGLLALVIFFRRQKTFRKHLRLHQNPNCSVDTTAGVLLRLVKLAIPVSMANIMLPVMNLIDSFIVPQRLMDIGYLMKEATTQYGYLTGMATSLVGLPVILTTSLAASLVPAVSELYSLKKKQDIRKRALTAMKIGNIFTIPSCIGMAVLATPVSSLLYATPNAGPAITVMSLSIIFLGWQQVTAGVLQGLGRTIIPMLTIAAGLIVKVLLDWQLTAIPWLGINGAAWASDINFAVAAILNFYFVKRYVGSIVDLREFFKILVSAFAMGGAASFMYASIVTLVGNVWAVGLTILVAGFVYGATLWLTKALVYKDLYNFPIIGKRLRAKDGKK